MVSFRPLQEPTPCDTRHRVPVAAEPDRAAMLGSRRLCPDFILSISLIKRNQFPCDDTVYYLPGSLESFGLTGTRQHRHCGCRKTPYFATSLKSGKQTSL
jgi:hypothetical protein